MQTPQMPPDQDQSNSILRQNLPTTHNSLIDLGFRARKGVQSLPLEVLPKMQAVDQGEK
jgi:hypothetical protein